MSSTKCTFAALPRIARLGWKRPGTYAAVIEKIPYLKELGVNCIELMPIFEFDELANERINPQTGEQLVNYWGYNPIGFFAPNAAYAASGEPALELKTLVKQCHRDGIEVWLDVVFNHTAEGNENGPTISYRGIDNKTYYLLKPDGGYYNFSGTGKYLQLQSSYRACRAAGLPALLGIGISH